MPETAELNGTDTGVGGIEPVRVMLVDDFPVVCTGLRLYLERYPDIVVDCEAYDSSAALELAVARHPSVAIIDVKLPPGDGITLAEQLRELVPETRVLLISGWFESYTIARGLKAGVNGFIEKTEFPQTLGTFVREISRGAFCCSQTIRDQIEQSHDGYRIARGPGSAVANLSPREREMLECLAEGASLKQAAQYFGMKYKSADHLKQTIMKKLNLHDRVDLVRFAIREGLLREPARDWNSIEPGPDEDSPPVMT